MAYGTGDLGVDKRVRVPRAYFILFASFALAFIYDLVMAQGDLSGVLQGAEMTILMFGTVALVVGYIMNLPYIDEEDKNLLPTAEDKRNLWRGLMLFVGMTLINMNMPGFSVYQSAMVTMSGVTGIVVVSAGIFEEALFRLFLSTIIYRFVLPATESGLFRIADLVMNRRSTILLTRSHGLRLLAMIITSVLVSLAFIAFHAEVQNIADVNVQMFFFVNSFAYTMAFLLTGDIMVSTIGHVLHNAAVVYL